MKNTLIALNISLIAVLGILVSWKHEIVYFYEPEVIQAVITGYSSTEDQTDSTPNLTAYNTKTRKGIVANNCLKKGTTVIIEGMALIVEDRKNSRYGCEWFDIWFSDRTSAINFGLKRMNVLILSNGY